MTVIIDMSPIPPEHTIWISVVLLSLIGIAAIWYMLRVSIFKTDGGSGQ